MDLLIGISDWIYGALNGLSGRYWLFDTLVALPMDNVLVKAGPVGACFAFAWYSAGDDAAVRRRRGILLVTLVAVLFTVAATKSLSGRIFVPRPFIQSQATYQLEGERLVEAPRRVHRVPTEGEYRDRHSAMTRGDVVQNDLGSFPSDHAGFYIAFALGILLACRRAGLVALGWTLFVILLSRIVTGMHSPLDIAAGGLIGAAILLAFQLLFRRWGARILHPVAGWTLRWPGLASALLFLMLFEAVATLENARNAGGTARDIVERLAG